MAHEYVDLNDVHVPTTGEIVPLAWFEQAVDNNEALRRPAHFLALANVDVTQNSSTAQTDQVEIQFSGVESIGGGMSVDTTNTVTMVTVARSGIYMVTAAAHFDTTAFGALPRSAMLIKRNDEIMGRDDRSVGLTTIMAHAMFRCVEGDTISAMWDHPNTTATYNNPRVAAVMVTGL